MIDRCNECKKFIFDFEKHKCPPKFIVWVQSFDETEEDNGTKVYAESPESAIELFCNQYDADYDYSFNGCETVFMIRDQNNILKKYSVIGSSVPYYAITFEEVING